MDDSLATTASRSPGRFAHLGPLRASWPTPATRSPACSTRPASSRARWLPTRDQRITTPLPDALSGAGRVRRRAGRRRCPAQHPRHRRRRVTARAIRARRARPRCSTTSTRSPPPDAHVLSSPGPSTHPRCGSRPSTWPGCCASACGRASAVLPAHPRPRVRRTSVAAERRRAARRGHPFTIRQRAHLLPARLPRPTTPAGPTPPSTTRRPHRRGGGRTIALSPATGHEPGGEALRARCPSRCGPWRQPKQALIERFPASRTCLFAR